MMGFSLKKMFSGSGWRKFKKVVGGVAKVGLSVIPGVGGVAGGLAGKLLNAKKLAGAANIIDKAKTGGKIFNIAKGEFRSTSQVLRMSPVMPGGSVATPYGVAPAPDGAFPPGYYGGGLSGFVKPKRRKPRKAATKRRTSSTRKRTASRKRVSSGRRLTFGSPAWRKKYLSKSYLAKKAKKRKAAS